MQFYQVKRMIRGLGGVSVLDLFSNFKWVRTSSCLIELLGTNDSSKWAIFGKQNWR